MKRLTYAILMATFIFLLINILNMRVITKQCIDYKCQNNTIPLYLKTLDFFDRHYNYKHLVENVIKGTKNEEERVMKILEWTISNLRRVPPGLPQIDDHVWYIIVRGYGANDQFQDVFATLCNYAKLNAFYRVFRTNNGNRTLSFVKLRNDWSVFDAYHGVYFRDRKGEIASINDLLAGDWQAVSLSNVEIPDYYSECFENLTFMNYDKFKLSRSAIQSPTNRLIFWNKNKK